MWMALLCAVVCGVGSAGCSMKRMAMGKVADALANSSTGTTFSGEDDPELVEAAIPFSLKLMESLMPDLPRHRGLLLSASSGFTQYSYAFVHLKADSAESENVQVADLMRDRARRLYLRARDYGLQGIELRHKGFRQALRAHPKDAVRLTDVKDVPYLYWASASWALAISISKNHAELIADQPAAEALIDRAFELDPKYEKGALHGFLIAYEGARQGIAGDARVRSRKHYAEVVRLTEGKLASPYVSLAEAVCITDQNRKEFEALLKQALEIDADEKKEWRLVNILMQRRARWLLSRADELFLPTGE